MGWGGWRQEETEGVSYDNWGMLGSTSNFNALTFLPGNLAKNTDYRAL